MTSTREQNFDSLYNEGGEGYNPYRGERAAAPAKSAEPKGRLVMYKGLPTNERDLRAKLARSEVSLTRVTDDFGRSIVERDIAAMRAALEG